jgi:hypothetical protein
MRTGPKYRALWGRRSLVAASRPVLAALLGLMAGVPAAHASYIVTFNQVESDVVATGSGTLNLTDALFLTDPPLLPEQEAYVINPSYG